ncbi:acyltransferase-domain-containing protein [Tilletiopsis washingtonensis]|uniref:1-acyl-sn-glycerol-3-phosphate acyltransferase n=1 Tax=Tilletiopsis washingtonensis TaxID=58919 RepID=A0A316ZGX3_9BASI|nr:acyltransferase-domain-containing protein [Tilletiopsis washingtonensis]PWO00507.1 acyltransferase-domain-containing protein [Tilletiopsis washingtonensis]
MALVTRSLAYTLGTAVLLLSLLSPRSQRARLYLNTIFYISGLGACSAFGVVCSLFLTLVPGANRLNTNYYVARSFYLLAGSLTGIRFRVEGEENFDKARPAVLVGNHQTGIDILYLGRIFPRIASIMAKQELKYAPLLGQFMSLSGAVFIDRKNRHDAVKSFNQVGQEMKKNGLSLWVFPEGTRSNLPFPDLLPFKKGAFHLAVQAQVPVVPVVCENYHRLFDGKTRFEGGTIRIKVLEPVPTKGLTADDVTDLTTRVRSLMLKELQAMDSERDAFDASATATATVPANRVRGEQGLGGVAGLMAKLIGGSSGRSVVRKADRDEQRLRKEGTSGTKPDDYGLVSEGSKGESSKSSALPQSDDASRRTGGNGSGSEQESEGSTVLVQKPSEK